MSNSINVKSAEAALAAISANPDGFLVIEKKKEDKAYKGTRYLNAKIKVGGSLTDGWISATDVQFGRGIADPADITDKRNEFEGTRLCVRTSKSRAGAYGEYLMNLDDVWHKEINKLSAAGTINITGKKIHGLVQKHTSENSKTPGLEIDDPIIQWKLDFTKYAETHPNKHLRGTQKTIILDYNKPIEGTVGPYQYHPATITDDDGREQPLTKDNVHLFWNDGCVGRFIRTTSPSVAISQAWISYPITIQTIVLERGSNGGFSDEFFDESAVGEALGVEQVIEPAVETPDASANIDDLLGEL